MIYSHMAFLKEKPDSKEISYSFVAQYFREFCDLTSDHEIFHTKYSIIMGVAMLILCAYACMHIVIAELVRSMYRLCMFTFRK